jgi:hypothetical protein
MSKQGADICTNTGHSPIPVSRILMELHDCLRQARELLKRAITWAVGRGINFPSIEMALWLLYEL